MGTSGAALVSPLADQPWGTRELRVADPAGHLLRIGSDLDSRDGTPRVTPELPVADALAAAAFCRDVLGMGPTAPTGGTPYFQRSHREGVILHWWAAAPSPFAPTLLAPRNRARGDIWDIAIEVRGVDALAAELAGRGAEIRRGPLTAEYGMREPRGLHHLLRRRPRLIARRQAVATVRPQLASGVCLAAIALPKSAGILGGIAGSGHVAVGLVAGRLHAQSSGRSTPSGPVACGPCASPRCPRMFASCSVRAPS